jgi:hypothetical protein
MRDIRSKRESCLTRKVLATILPAGLLKRYFGVPNTKTAIAKPVDTDWCKRRKEVKIDVSSRVVCERAYP